jgi:plasmid stability protein
MGQILVRRLDDTTIERLKVRARERKTSVEALAREALTGAARLTTQEKLALVRQLQDWGRRAINPDVAQTPTLELIREDRDNDY